MTFKGMSLELVMITVQEQILNITKLHEYSPIYMFWRLSKCYLLLKGARAFFKCYLNTNYGPFYSSVEEVIYLSLLNKTPSGLKPSRKEGVY